MRKLLPLLAIIVLAGCNEPRIDGSSPEAFEKSVEQMQSGMTDQEKMEFSLALAVVMMKYAFEDLQNLGRDALAGGFNPEMPGDGMSSEVFQKLDGMTRSQVLREAKSFGSGL